MKSSSTHERQHPSIISYIIFRRLAISPDFRVSRLGIKEGLRTMYSISWTVKGHYRHKFSWIATDGKEFQPSFLHEIFESGMRGYSYSMAISLEMFSQGNERLYIASGANNLNDNIHLRRIPIIRLITIGKESGVEFQLFWFVLLVGW